MAIRPPEHLSPSHDLSTFRCGEPILDQWLKDRAAANERTGASRTYVLRDEATVVGYYCLAAGSVSIANAPGRVRRNMPDPVPVIVLGRLAVDSSMHGRGLGRGLVRDAMSRSKNVAEIAGVRAVLVHALSESAVAFYEKNGFRPSPIDPMLLMVTMDDIVKAGI